MVRKHYLHPSRLLTEANARTPVQGEGFVGYIFHLNPESHLPAAFVTHGNRRPETHQNLSQSKSV